MRVFSRVAETASFTRVAHELELSSSYVSKLVMQLEQSLGAKLLQRTTRRLQLTEAGRAYHVHCVQILEHMDRAESLVAEWGNFPKGRLRINLPLSFSLCDLGPVMASFGERYPELDLDLTLSDQQIDLLKEGFDCGLRLTTDFKDSSYVGIPIASFRIMVCAAPRYLKRHGVPATPQDLQQHRCFVYSYASGHNRWPLRTADQSHIAVNSTWRMNSTPFMKHFIIEGQGLGVLPEFVARPEIEDGRLVEVLEEVERPELKLYAVYPARKLVPAKVQVWIDFMREEAYRWGANKRG
ncbi:LysR substrate-binding domain-containing protein [Herbaspirillum sp. GCM10030257]|uniref:LysR family transcriptional regulator n=1 Tax=Herbaspirillum sp. GCM10030257 TaxID=3273393 RepID=UPI00361EE9FB